MSLQSGGFKPRNSSKSLGKFEIQVFGVEGDMMSDTAMSIKVILKDTLLEDTRPSKQTGITR